MMLRKGILGICGILFLLVVLQGVHAALPPDIDDRMYYPGSEYYPDEYCWKYIERYTKIVSQDITVEAECGTLTVGKILMIITPLPNYLEINNKHHAYIDGNSRRFFIDVIVYYDAGNYYDNRPAVRYHNTINEGQIPNINAFWINTIQLEADFSTYDADPSWHIESQWGGEAYSYFPGKWVLSENPDGDNTYDRLLDKSTKCQFVATGVEYVPDAYRAWEQWKNKFIDEWKADENYSKAISSIMYICSVGEFAATLAGYTVPPIGLAISSMQMLHMAFSTDNYIVSREIDYLIEHYPTEWRSANTYGNGNTRGVSRATWHFPEPVRKSEGEEQSDCTSDSYPDYFWHYKNWVAAAHITSVLTVTVYSFGSGSNNQLDIPVRAKIYLNWGPHPALYTTIPPVVVQTTLKISANPVENFGISAIPSMSTYDDYDPGVTYAFTFHLDGNTNLNKISYFIDWGDGTNATIENVNPSYSYARQHSWNQGTYIIQIFCYGKRSDGKIVISSVTQYTISVYDEDDGDNDDSGGGAGPIGPGFPNHPPIPLGFYPTAEQNF